MFKLAPFLDKYKTIIFDMDGVISSEQTYWNTAAMTVYELLNSKNYYGDGEINVDWVMQNFKPLRDKIFCDDKTIKLLKNKGVNSNWDLAYIVVCASLILGDKEDFVKIYDYSKNLGDNILDEYDDLAKKVSEKTNIPYDDCLRTGKLWADVQYVFQEWYLGEENFANVWKRETVEKNKPGLMYNEVPLIDHEKLILILKMLYERGVNLGTGTGRPYHEITYPMSAWKIGEYIDPKRRINYNHVMNAEEYFRNKGISVAFTKPHPYMFIKALYGEDYSDDKILAEDYDKSLIKSTLVVGDAGADILAAKAMGADFVAVLTGVSGQSARRYFESVGAEYILDSLEDFLVEDEKK